MPINPSDAEEEYFKKEEVRKLREQSEITAREKAEEDRDKLKELHWMHCPKCGLDLVEVEYRDVQVDTCFQCGASLGWGDCGDSVCHYGTHWINTSSDGNWSHNQSISMHFPSAYSTYRMFGDVNNPPTAWCRSCGGGLPAVLNSSTTCCGTSSFNARLRWTLWVR